MNCYIALAVKYQVSSQAVACSRTSFGLLSAKVLSCPCTKDAHTPTGVGKARNKTKRNAPQCKPRPKLSCHSYVHSTVPAAACQVHPNTWNFVPADMHSDYIHIQDKTSLCTQAFPTYQVPWVQG